jgi:hypothetical protein
VCAAAEAQAAIFDFIEVFYKRRLRHYLFGYLCSVYFGNMNYEIKWAA